MKINKSDFLELIRKNVSGFKIETVKLENSLADLGLDSLGLATLLFAIEDELKIQLEDPLLTKLSSMSTVAEFLVTFETLGIQIEI